MRNYHKKPTFEDLFEGQAVLMTDKDPFHGIQRCTIVTTERHDIPVLVWEWEPTAFLFFSAEDMLCLTRTQQEFVKERFRHNARENSYSDCIRWKDKRLNAASLMNFRRYGWATAPGVAPVEGWAGPDIIWPNRCCGPVPCRTVDEAMLASLSSVITEAQCHYKIPQELVENCKVRVLYRELLDDALANGRAREWADRAVNNDDNGAIADVTVFREHHKQRVA